MTVFYTAKNFSQNLSFEVAQTAFAFGESLVLEGEVMRTLHSPNTDILLVHFTVGVESRLVSKNGPCGASRSFPSWLGTCGRILNVRSNILLSEPGPIELRTVS